MLRNCYILFPVVETVDPSLSRSVDGCPPCRETRRELRLSPENICQVVQFGLSLAGQPLLIHYVTTEQTEYTERENAVGLLNDCERAFLKMLMTKLIKALQMVDGRDGTPPKQQLRNHCLLFPCLLSLPWFPWFRNSKCS